MKLMINLILMLPYLLLLVGMVYYSTKKYREVNYWGVKVFAWNGAGFYTVGVGKKSKILVGIESVEGLNHNEVMAMIFHEQGHIHYNHILKNLIYLFIIFVGLTTFVWLATDMFLYVGVVLYISSVTTLFRYNLRLQEYIADTYSAKFIDKVYLLSAIEKLAGEKGDFIHPNYKKRAINLGCDEKI